MESKMGTTIMGSIGITIGFIPSFLANQRPDNGRHST